MTDLTVGFRSRQVLITLADSVFVSVLLLPYYPRITLYGVCVNTRFVK